MMEQGWIKIHRKITKWEWYDDANTFRVFFHILINANHEDARWRGYDIKRGQFATSVKRLSRELKLSDKSVRVSLDHLKRTNEMASKGNNTFSLFTVLKYDEYQTKGEPNDKRGANEGQTKGDKQERKEYKNDKNKEVPRKTEELVNHRTHQFLKDSGVVDKLSDSPVRLAYPKLTDAELLVYVNEIVAWLGDKGKKKEVTTMRVLNWLKKTSLGEKKDDAFYARELERLGFAAFANDYGLAVAHKYSQC
jgi:Mn-dependent DtxR family transcriptional regulator